MSPRSKGMNHPWHRWPRNVHLSLFLIQCKGAKFPVTFNFLSIEWMTKQKSHKLVIAKYLVAGSVDIFINMVFFWGDQSFKSLYLCH